MTILSALTVPTLLLLFPVGLGTPPTDPPRDLAADRLGPTDRLGVAVSIALAEHCDYTGPLCLPEFALLPTPPHSACVNAALTELQAAQVAARADFMHAVAKCIGAHGSFARCVGSLWDEYREARDLADTQFNERRQVCRLLGEDRYAPHLDPRQFCSQIDNRYFPLVVGRRLIYRSNAEPAERTRVVALAEPYEVAGVECRVVRDTVTVDGELLEDTRDWYAQHVNGDVWYLGEIALNYEDGAVHDVDGSWRAAEDGAQAGILMRARPAVGDVYRQELLLGEAEDLGMVVAVGQTVTVAAGTFHDCVQTEDWTPLEPGVRETKFYAPDVGFVLGINLTSGTRTELVQIVEPR